MSRSLIPLTLSLFAYVGVVFSVDLPWSEVINGVFFPSLTLSADYVATVVFVDSDADLQKAKHLAMPSGSSIPK